MNKLLNNPPLPGGTTSVSSTINRLLMFSIIIALAPFVIAAEKTEKPAIPTRSVSLDAKDSPHILFVNVGKALADADFAEGVARVNAQYGFNIWTNSIDHSVVSDLVKEKDYISKRFGRNAVIAVFVEKDQEADSFFQSPCRWSMVNMNRYDVDHPSEEARKNRIHKMFLKGLAFASGTGSNADPHCAMFCGSFTLKGIDATSASLGPQAYYPIMQNLKSLGEHAPFMKSK